MEIAELIPTLCLVYRELLSVPNVIMDSSEGMRKEEEGEGEVEGGKSLFQTPLDFMVSGGRIDGVGSWVPRGVENGLGEVASILLSILALLGPVRLGRWLRGQEAGSEDGVRQVRRLLITLESIAHGAAFPLDRWLSLSISVYGYILMALGPIGHYLEEIGSLRTNDGIGE